MYKKFLATAALFATPLICAAYDYDAYPKPEPQQEKELTYEEAYPDMKGKSYLEIEDIDTKVARLARQAQYKKQQSRKNQQAEQVPAAQEGTAPTPEVEAAGSNPAKNDPKKQTGAQVKEVWSASPVTGAHDWTAAPAVKEDTAPAKEVWSASPVTGTHDWTAAPAPKKEDTANGSSSEEFPEK